MIITIHEQQGKVLVAVCDSKLLGKKFIEGDAQIDLTSDFYQGVEKSEEEIGDVLRNADSINLVGEQAVALGIKEEIIDEEHVVRVQDIPLAQGAILRE